VPSTTIRRRAGGLVIAAVVATLAIGPSWSAAAPADARSERERVRREAAEVASELDVLNASNAEVTAALDALNANVAGEEAALADSQRALAEANAALAAARQREADTQTEINGLNETLSAVAVEAYMNAGTLEESTAILQSEDIEEGVQRRSLVDLRAGQYRDVLDQLRTLSEELAIARGEAETAAAAAEQHQGEVATRLDSAQAARDQQAAVAAEVDARLDHALGEAASLAELDSQLSAQIAAEQAAIAARSRASSSSGSGSGGSGSSGNGSSGSGSRVSSGPVNSGSLCLQTVRGITVACSISGSLESMMAAAAGDGLTLAGGGYRDSSNQIALRRAHCGTSDYAIYEMSPSSCSPPTARPGQSMHEQGLAIDFTCGGGGAIGRSSPCFSWLQSNAGSYGFVNLPSEPWHWSTNGN
jgi:peptidoglycan hydrolase CwlO-like protein